MLVLEGVTIKLDLIGVRLDWEKREKLEDFLCFIGEKAGFKGFCVTIDESFGVPKKKLWKQLMYLFLHIKMLDSKISFTFNTFSSAFTLYSSASFWFPVFFTILLYSFLLYFSILMENMTSLSVTCKWLNSAKANSCRLLVFSLKVPINCSNFKLVESFSFGKMLII